MFPQSKLLATCHVNASRPHADSGLPSRLSLDLSQASPTRRKEPALLTHFNLTPGGLDQTLQEVPAATHQPKEAGDTLGSGLAAPAK